MRSVDASAACPSWEAAAGSGHVVVLDGALDRAGRSARVRIVVRAATWPRGRVREPLPSSSR